MSDAELQSINSTTQDLENANSEGSGVAVSEENLAALMRATISPAEPEAERVAEGANPAPVSDHNEPPSGAREPHADRPAPPTTPPANIVESRLALFAAVKENRSAISRSGASPAAPVIEQPPTGKAKIITSPVERHENPSVSLPPKAAPRPNILPQTVPVAPEPVVSIPTPSQKAVSEDQTGNTSRTGLVIGLGIVALIATVGALIFFTRWHSPKTANVAVSAPKNNVPGPAPVQTPLQVRVEPLGKGSIDVRWNPQSTSIAQAREGRLVITEHNQKPRTVALEAAQLKTGHITYQSAAESIEFDLEIVDSSGAIVKESVLAMQSPGAAQSPTQPAPQPSHEQTATAKPQNAPTPAPVAEVQQPSQPSVRTFVAPATQRNTEQRAIVDAPPVLTNGPVMPEVRLPVPVAATLPPPTKEVPVQKQVLVASSVQAANLIKQVLPIYPQIARSARIQGAVRFTAHIGQDGRILNLKFMNGPSVLVDSASTAVKQWVYRPTLLNGVPVDVITQIDVNFSLK